MHQAVFGQPITLQAASNPGVLPIENINPILVGSYLVGFLNEGTAGGPDWIATANSGVMFQNSPANPIHEPGSLALTADWPPITLEGL